MNIGSFISKGHLLLTCWSDYCESGTSDNKLICISIVVLYNNFEGCIICFLKKYTLSWGDEVCDYCSVDLQIRVSANFVLIVGSNCRKLRLFTRSRKKML